MEPINGSEWERHVVAMAKTAIVRIQSAPWDPHVRHALEATAQLRGIVGPFAVDYASEHHRDTLPSWWTKE